MQRGSLWSRLVPAWPPQRAPAIGWAWALPLLEERPRWFLWLAPLFATGIAIYFALPFEPQLAGTLLGFAVPVVLRLGVIRDGPAALAASVVIIVTAGFTAAKVRTEAVRAPILSHTIRPAIVTGVIERREQRADASLRLTLSVREIEGLEPAATPKRVRVLLRPARRSRTPAADATSSKATGTNASIGSLIRLSARLSPPTAPVIPGGWDFARAAYFKGIGATGFATGAPEVIAQVGEVGWHAAAQFAIESLRQRIGERVLAALDGQSGAMAMALMTGDRSAISEATSKLFRDAGIVHILSISGLHMAIMGGSVFITLRFLLAALPFIALTRPIKKWAAVGALFAAFGYLLISGAAHPAVRSFIMILIVFLAILFDRPALALRNVAIAALTILLVMPESLFNAGFQLSFAAVTALIAVYEAHRARRHRLRRAGHLRWQMSAGERVLSNVAWFIAGIILTTVVAGLATAPLAAYHFHTSQQYAVLTNLIAVPLANFIVMPAALAAFLVMPFGLEGWPLAAMGLGLDAMTWTARQVTGLSGAVIAVPAFAPGALLLMVIGGLWLVIWLRPWRWFGLVMALAGLIIAIDVQRPAALIGRDGSLVALRGRDGRYGVVRSGRAGFELRHWLEHDGDRRAPAALRRGRAWRCDADGCIARLDGHVIAVARSPAALVDDCQRATVLIMSFPKPAGCRTAATVIDFRALRRQGTHALYLSEAGDLRIETVDQLRGDRPWSMAARFRGQRRRWRRRGKTALSTKPTAQPSAGPSTTSPGLRRHR